MRLLFLKNGRDVVRFWKGLVAKLRFCKHCRQVKNSFERRGAKLLNIGAEVPKEAIAAMAGNLPTS